VDFGLSEDQLLLDQTVRSFLADQVPIERVRELREKDCPNDRAIWKSLAELGITGVLVPEAQGGSGLALLDAAIIAQALGHAVTPTAYLSSAVMAAVALGQLGGGEAEGWLTGIASGETVVGVATTELYSLREDAGVRLDGGKLSGKAMMAIDVCGADLVLLAIDDETLAVVACDTTGLTTTRLRTTDATRCTAELVLEDVVPEATFEGAGQAITRMLQAGRIVLAADALGACESMIEQAVAYAKQRKQFNRLIGSFQAVKHMCSEMIAELEPAKVEGGIGWTDEQNLHFWFKRIGNARHLLGGPEYLRNQAAEIQGLTTAA